MSFFKNLLGKGTASQRPRPPEGCDEETAEIFEKLRDVICDFKESRSLEWQHCLPGMQRVAIIYHIKARGKEKSLQFFQSYFCDLDRDFGPVSGRSPFQPNMTPQQITNMAKFNEHLLFAAEKMEEIVEVHPATIANTLTLLITVVTETYYDYVALQAVIAVICADLEGGMYDSIKRTNFDLG